MFDSVIFLFLKRENKFFLSFFLSSTGVYISSCSVEAATGGHIGTGAEVSVLLEKEEEKVEVVIEGTEEKRPIEKGGPKLHGGIEKGQKNSREKPILSLNLILILMLMLMLQKNKT